MRHTIRHKRQSTTKRLTLSDLDLIATFIDLEQPNGVIVRYMGREYGVVSVIGKHVKTLEGVWFRFNELTIPKSTIDTLWVDLLTLDPSDLLAC